MGIASPRRRSMSKIYLYKMTTDSGGAPCVHRGTLSLAICKPAIRTSAGSGDYILGFAGNSLYKNNCLVYASEVSRSVPGTDYFGDDFSYRPDCIYEFLNGHYRWRPDAKYHSPEDLEHDLGKSPDYKRARVLLTENHSDFRYFGSSCPIPYQSKYVELSDFIREMTQGHRRNLSKSLQTAVLALLADVWTTEAIKDETNVPSTRSLSKCGQDEGGAECDC